MHTAYSISHSIEAHVCHKEEEVPLGRDPCGGSARGQKYRVRIALLPGLPRPVPVYSSHLRTNIHKAPFLSQKCPSLGNKS